MITIIAKITVKPGMAQVFTAGFSGLAPESRKEAGCISYNLFSDLKDGNVFYTVEEWENEEAIKKHMQSPHFLKATAGFAEIQDRETEISLCKKVL